jgi:hypothetical protein
MAFQVFMMSKFKCFNCGKPVDDLNGRCPSCYTDLSKTPKEVIRCKNGHIISKDAQYCPWCGQYTGDIGALKNPKEIHLDQPQGKPPSSEDFLPKSGDYALNEKGSAKTKRIQVELEDARETTFGGKRFPARPNPLEPQSPVPPPDPPKTEMEDFFKAKPEAKAREIETPAPPLSLSDAPPGLGSATNPPPGAKAAPEPEYLGRRTVRIPRPDHQGTLIFRDGVEAEDSKRKLVGFLVSYTLSTEGAFFPLTEGRQTIGRRRGMRINVTDMRLSEAHAVIVYNDGKFTFTDLCSTNGSVVDGKEVLEPTLLENGSEIKMGSHTYHFVAINKRS